MTTNGEPHLLSDQLDRAVRMAAKQDRIAWTVFGVFWAGNGVLFATYLADADGSEAVRRIALSITGIALAGLWAMVQRRAVAWLRFYEKVIDALERELKIPSEFALSGMINEATFDSEVKTTSTGVRGLMTKSPVSVLCLWVVALYIELAIT